MAAISLSSATLRIYGDDADPDQISALLGCTPSDSYRKGDATYPPKNLKPRRHGMWRLMAEDCEPEALDSQITGILNRVTQDLAIWKQIAASHEVDLFCGLFMNDSNEGLGLSPQTLALLAERGIALDLDIYGPASGAAQPESPSSEA